MRYLLIILLSVLISCNGEKINPGLTGSDGIGVWVDVNTKTDTLTFQSIDGMEIVNLSRGLEMRGGELLPKIGSGPYQYKLLEEEKISLYWMPSSFLGFNEYTFKQSGDLLIVEKFFDSPSPGVLLTFERVK
ncbi:MAG: hypothetical protein OEY34_01315 [Cyclobacteriaceae bacterium]|nr:hypothetical protein [Cyclobacteriaceae bacterium]